MFNNVEALASIVHSYYIISDAFNVDISSILWVTVVTLIIAHCLWYLVSHTLFAKGLN